MPKKYTATRPLKIPRNGWPALSEEAKRLVLDLTERLNAIGKTPSPDPRARLTIIEFAVDALAYEVAKIVPLSVGSLDDPLA